MRRYTILVSIFLVFVLVSPVMAEDYPTYAGRKLGRGLSNAALGWTELLKSEEDAGNNHGPAAALFWGPLDGIGNTIKRTAIGVYEVATFPIQTSKNADPLIKPEFVGTDSTNKPGYRPKDYTF